MHPEIGQNPGRHQAGTILACVESLAEGSGADWVGWAVEEMEARALASGEREVVGDGEGDAGAADDDPVGEVEEGGGVAPVWESLEGVSAEDGEELVGRLAVSGGAELGTETAKGVDGVIGLTTEVGGVDGRGGEGGFVSAEELGHVEAVGKGGDRAARFERLPTGGGE